MPTYYAVPIEPINTTEQYTPTKRRYLFWNEAVGETITRQRALSGHDLRRHFEQHTQLIIYTDNEVAYDKAKEAAHTKNGYLSSAKPLYIIELSETNIEDQMRMDSKHSKAKLLQALLVQPGSDGEKDEPIAVYCHDSWRTSRFVFKLEREEETETTFSFS